MKKLVTRIAWIGVGLIHAYLASEHISAWVKHGATFEDVWKSIGASVGCLAMLYLGLRKRKKSDTKEHE